MNAPVPKKANWLLRIFLGCFLLAVAAPVGLALAILSLSGDTRALRNAALQSEHAQWKKKFEVNLGSLPFAAARMALPFVDIPTDAKLAFSALRGVDVSVHELNGSQLNRAGILSDADARMAKRGWDRVVCVLNPDVAVAVYVQSKSDGDLKISTLVLAEGHLVTATGRGNIQPILELVLKKASEEGLLARHP